MFFLHHPHIYMHMAQYGFENICLQSTATAGDEKRYCHCETNCIVFNDCCLDTPPGTSLSVLHEGLALDNDSDLKCVSTNIATDDPMQGQ